MSLTPRRLAGCRPPTRPPGATHDREILRLAVPAFLALVAEPMFLLADAAIVGHLGTPELAGLGIAGAVLQTAVGLCVFLAYGTTASVARRVGSGDVRGALAQGVDGVWLAVLIGTVTTVAGVLLAGRLVGLFGAGPAVDVPATTYLRLAFLGVIPLLVMLAATGVLRGLQDTRTPLVVAVVGNLAQHRAQLGRWSSASTSASPAPRSAPTWPSSGSAAALLAVVVRAARREGASLRPDLAGVRRAAHAGVALVVRTLTLRASLLVTTYVAASLGAASVATHQLALTIWTFLAFALDAIAIAAQALTGRSLGAGDLEGTRAITRRMVQWGVAVRRGHRRAARGGRPAARRAVHRRPRGARPALAGAAGGRGLPAGRRRGVRAGRRADRRRGRPLPRLGRDRRPRGLRAAGPARRPARVGARRRPDLAVGWRSASASSAAGPSCCCTGRAARPGWSPAADPGDSGARNVAATVAGSAGLPAPESPGQHAFRRQSRRVSTFSAARVAGSARFSPPESPGGFP